MRARNLSFLGGTAALVCGAIVTVSTTHASHSTTAARPAARPAPAKSVSTPVFHDHDIIAVAATQPVAAVVVPDAKPAPVVRRSAPPRPAPPPAASPGSIRAIIIAAANAHGVSAQWMLNIAACESGFNPRAVNPNGYYGLFQFSPSTFRANGGTNIWDPVQQSNITATMLAHGQAHQWSCA